jgi:hypothetical protein
MITQARMEETMKALNDGPKDDPPYRKGKGYKGPKLNMAWRKLKEDPIAHEYYKASRRKAYLYRGQAGSYKASFREAWRHKQRQLRQEMKDGEEPSELEAALMLCQLSTWELNIVELSECIVNN